MVQPFSSTKAAIDFINFDPGSLSKRPRLAAHVIEVIGTWSHCDAMYGAMLTAMLKMDFKVATRMFLAMHSPDARWRLISAAAYEALDDEDFGLFNAVRKCVKPAENHRNAFAHGIWGIAHELPDALLRVDATHYTEIHIYIAEHTAGLAEKKRADNQALNPNEIEVYREPDLAAELEIARIAYKRMRILTASITRGKVFEKGRKALSNDPEIARALASQSQKNTQSVQPQSPEPPAPEKTDQ